MKDMAVLDTFVNVYLSTELSKVIEERLKFSKYLINPNKFHFTKLVRVFAIVIVAAKCWLGKLTVKRFLQRFSSGEKNVSHLKVVQMDQESNTLFAVLSDEDLQYSKNYFFKKATEEVKSYTHPKHYDKFSEERDNILYYVGRVTNSDITFDGNFTEKMLDLADKSFVVPIIDSKSPLAYSIMNDVHWNDPDAKHRGVETTIRAVLSIAYKLNVG